MFKRLKTLWKLSSLEIKDEPKSYVNDLLTVDGVKERLGIKKMAKIIEDEPVNMFPLEDKIL